MTSTAVSPCIATFGKSTMEKLREVCMFTTLMGTSRTTASRILSCFQPVTIAPTTAAQIRGLVARQTSDRLLALENWLKRGTQALKDLLGILRTVGRHGKTGQQPLSSAASVVQTMKPFIRPNQNSAVKIAKLKRLTGEAARRPVYDLTVDHHHCYIANGVLVSNSDSFGLMAIVADAIGAESPAAKPIAYRNRRFIA